MANWREVIVSGSNALLETLGVDSTITGSLVISGSMKDGQGGTGTLGQVLSSTVTGSLWIDISGAGAQGTQGTQGIIGCPRYNRNTRYNRYTRYTRYTRYNR